jgi:hypothetical protein
MGNPGHADLILAEFQTKLRAGELTHPIDPPDADVSPRMALITRWAILAVVSSAVALLYYNWVVTAAIAAFILLAAAREIWLWRGSRADRQLFLPAEERTDSVSGVFLPAEVEDHA